MSVMVDPMFEAEAAYRAERVRADFRPSPARSTARRTGPLRGALRRRRGAVGHTSPAPCLVCPGHATPA